MVATGVTIAFQDAMIAASETELLDWDMHQLECLLQLGDWEVPCAAIESPRFSRVSGNMVSS